MLISFDTYAFAGSVTYIQMLAQLHLLMPIQCYFLLLTSVLLIAHIRQSAETQILHSLQHFYNKDMVHQSWNTLARVSGLNLTTLKAGVWHMSSLETDRRPNECLAPPSQVCLALLEKVKSVQLCCRCIISWVVTWRWVAGLRVSECMGAELRSSTDCPGGRTEKPSPGGSLCCGRHTHRNPYHKGGPSC